jgi:protein gp37
MSAHPGLHRAESNKHGALSGRTAGGLLGIKPAEFTALPAPDWIIAGAESGAGRRPFDPAWARSVRDQCAAAGVAFFFKQDIIAGRKVELPLLDGRQHVEWPS